MMMILIILTVIEVQAIDIIMSSFFYPSLVSITLPQLSKVDVIRSSLITCINKGIDGCERKKE